MNLSPVTESAANTYTQVETILPVRLSEKQVIEILKAEFEVNTSAGAAGADEQFSVDVQVTKRTQTAGVRITDPDLVVKHNFNGVTLFAEPTETGGGPAAIDNLVLKDYQVNGKGFLVASQSLFVGVTGVNQISARQGFVRLLYRIVKVSAEELIGLVSQ